MHAQEGGPYARQIALQRIERAVAGRVPVRSFPIGREKAPSIDFSIGQVGERLVEDEHGRNHEVWQHVREKRAQLGAVERQICSVLSGDMRHERLTASRLGVYHHSGVLNGGMRVQRRFDLFGLDSNASNFGPGVLPSFVQQTSVGQEAPQVSSAIDPLAGLHGIGHEDRIRQLRPLPVTRRQEPAPNRNLTDLLPTHFTAFIVEDENLLVARRDSQPEPRARLTRSSDRR